MGLYAVVCSRRCSEIVLWRSLKKSSMDKARLQKLISDVEEVVSDYDADHPHITWNPSWYEASRALTEFLNLHIDDLS